MRKLIFDTLTEEFASEQALLTATVPRIYPAGALGTGSIPAKPPKPFFVVRALPSQKYRTVRETGKPVLNTFQLWCYDEKGSPTRIDEYLQRAEDALRPLTGVYSANGNRCLGVNWLGVSQDFTDDEYDAIVRYGNLQMSSSR